MVLAAALVGTAPNIARIGLNWGEGALGPQGIVFWRFVFAAVVLAAILYYRDGRLPARPRPIVLAGAAFFALDLALWHWAIGITTIANSSFLVSMGNLCLGLTMWLALDERPARLWFLALPFAIGGAFLLSQGGAGGLIGLDTTGEIPGGAPSPDWRGDLLAVGAAICASLYLLCSRIARDRLDGLTTIYWLCVGGAATAAVILVLSGEALWPADPTSFLIPLAIAIFVQVAGQGLLVTALGQMPASKVSLLFLLQPVVAAGLAILLFSERLQWAQMAGIVAILLAIALAGRPRASRDDERSMHAAS